ncbi:X8 domain [Sesbania bispinosa]|nr:X8 domain [Sesbania bispinosa]
MARAEFLMWAFCMILFLAHCQQQGGHGVAETVPGIGVNWGAIASHPMEPPIVVNMLKDNGIKKVKLFEADSWTVSAFSGTDIELMVGIPNDQLKKLSKSKGRAEDWVKHNVSKHMHDGGVNIRYVSVGNEAFLKSYNGSFIETTFPAMENIQRAIDKAGFGDKIKVTTALNADVYESGSNKPSDGEFRKDIYDVMKPIVQFLDEKKSPFVVNIYPFLSLYQNEDFPKDFAFFDSPSRTIDDKNHHYNNMFDANLDTLIWSLKKMGHPNVSIMIGEIGWPTDGDKNANPQNAKRFYQGFLKKMASKKGTPLHPGHINTYLFSLFDENKKSIAPGDFERHWGKGEDKMPIGAKGVRYQEHKWCVLRKDVKNMSELSEALSYACAGGDCTSLGPDCSCADLNEAGNASYAFNQYFQINDQSVEACDFNGVATIVSEEPSKGSCLFPVAIISSGTMLKGTRVGLSLCVFYLRQFHCKGVVHEVDLDLDMWSYFEARDLVKDLGVDGNFKLWWNLDGNSDVGGWKPLTEDKEASDLATTADENVGEAHIFVEIVDGIQSGGTGYGATTTMGYSSDDSVRGVHFDDSEEERAVGLDDGFDVGSKGHEGGQDDGDVGDGGRRGDKPVQIEPGSGEGSRDDDGPVQIKPGSGEGSRDDDGPVQNDNVTGEGSRDDDGPVQNDNLTGEGSRDDDGPVQNDNLTGEGYMHGEPVFDEGNRDNGPQPIHELEENYVSEELNSDDPDLDSDEAER